ncbi:hypothetical protein SCLCIDRAFT_1192901 [Scleroderma citrinum Foug A]|uniref:Uncharacterized protein n=1 Tax=Scleroderma citrinum Foug A TaxID=1036808 RepID=A0A0C3DP09_9AGAM|nr:hypothetical protein SCLCIDRAFT_1192901 [Scleroderma citrinum Foug A]
MPNLGQPPPRADSRLSMPAEDPPPTSLVNCPVPRSSTIPIKNIKNNTVEEVKDARSARKLLDNMQYTIAGVPMTLEHLSHKLFYIFQKAVTPTLCSMICTAAFLTLELTSSSIISSVKQALSSTDLMEHLTSAHHIELSEMATKLDLALEKWSDQQETWMKTLDKISQIDDPINMIQLETRIHLISEGMASIQKMIEDMKVQNAASTLTTPPQQCSCCPTYKEALLNHPSPPDDIYPPEDQMKTPLTSA